MVRSRFSQRSCHRRRRIAATGRSLYSPPRPQPGSRSRPEEEECRSAVVAAPPARPAASALRNQPHRDAGSRLSPYLHFGQISPLTVALRVDAAGHASREDRDAVLEELLVRRELAVNFVHHAPEDYDRYRGLPGWARRTLAAHRDDPRPHRYSRRELEEARTHDRVWNAAMREMRHTGYLHNHLRMYWGKKILEWCNTPEYAHRVALELNDRWFLDGRDPSSYANVGWLFGLHDRPWPERRVYGTVRSMSAAGLARKTDPDAYVARVERLLAGGGA